MWLIQVLISLIIAIIFNYLFYNHEKMRNLKAFVYKLFWVEEISNSENKHKFAFKFMNFGVKFFMYPYVIFVSYYFIFGVLSLSISPLIFSVIMAIIWPIGYRIVMGLQRKFHGI